MHPMVNWPGQPGGAPPNALMAVAGRQPMFGQDPGPQYTGPFNAPNAPFALQMAAPMLFSGLAGPDRMPAQFFPQQNFYDQMKAEQFYLANQMAASVAARQDTRAFESTLGGLTQMMTGQPLTQMETARNHQIANATAQIMPYMTQVLGPDLVDALHGSRGSSAIMAQQLHKAFQTRLDPVTGMAGYSGQAAGQTTQAVFDRLFGDDAELAQMRGLSAGQAGLLAGELQSRGMLGRSISSLPLDMQRGRLAANLDTRTVNRLAETLPEIQDIRKAGGMPTEKDLETARQKIVDTNDKLTDPGVALTKDQLTQLPGAEGLLQSADGERISERLKSMAGAVKAMRDIFGDMGNPNAPMREIISGLEALTQGGLATMSPGDLENMVRKTHTIARQTGIGVEGIMALSSQNAGLADQLGVNRSFAIRAAQQSALYGRAAGDTLSLETPVYGGLTMEQITLADTQLRMHAAASPLANQLGGIARLADMGMAAPKDDTELAAIIGAVKGGDMNYTFGGQTRNLARMTRSRLVDILGRDAGLAETEANAVLRNRTGNQEAIEQYNIDDTVRGAQAAESVNLLMRSGISSRLNSALSERGVFDELQRSGAVGNKAEFRRMMDAVAGGIGQDFLRLDSDVVNSPADRREALGQSMLARMRQAVEARMPNAPQAEIDAAMAAVEGQLGADGLNAAGGMLDATIDSAAASNPLYKSAVGWYQLNSRDAMKAAASRSRQASAEALMQSAMAGLGTAGPVQRVVDTLQQASPETTMTDLLQSLLGGVSKEDVSALQADGPVAQLFGLAKESAGLNAADPEQFKQIQRNSGIIKALVEGGAVARSTLKSLEGSDQLTPALRQQLTEAADGKTASSILRDLGYMAGASVSRDQLAAVADAGTTAEKALQGEATDESGKAVDAFLRQSSARSLQLIGDERSMLQLGHGGLGLVQQAQDSTTTLQRLAEKHNVTVEQLLRGEGVPEAARKEAQTAMQQSQASWAEINKRRAFDMLPGKGRNAANIARQSMTEQEQRMLKGAADFSRRFGTDEEQAEDVVDRLLKGLSPEQAARAGVAENKQRLIDEIAEGAKGGGIDRALRSQKELLETGLRKGVFGDKHSIDELTDAEKSTVGERLDKVALTDPEREMLSKLKKTAAPLAGAGEVAAGKTVEDLLQRIRGFAEGRSGEAPENKEQQTLAVTLKGGSITIKDDNTADVEMQGDGLFQLIQRFAGVG